MWISRRKSEVNSKQKIFCNEIFISKAGIQVVTLLVLAI